jgi:excinuclease ABC subunit C
MELHEKIRTLPTNPGVYLYKNAEGEVIYVGKAKNLRARVRNYFVEGASDDAKTGSLLREAVDIEYIVVDNEKEALALENNLIKQKKPRFNILLRDDKTYPYVKLTMGERFPRVYVTRRLKKDGSLYFGPYLPASLAYRVVDIIHRHFLIPSCKIDLNRYHPRPCLQYYIGRCLGPCVENLTTPEQYTETIRDVRLFLEGHQDELSKSLTARMMSAAEAEQYELAAKYRDLISTVEQLTEKQRMASTDGDDADVFGYHYENGMIAVNLFHMRKGRMLDRREFFWEDLPELANTPDAVIPSEAGAPSLREAKGWVGVVEGPAFSGATDDVGSHEGSAFSPATTPASRRDGTFDPSTFFSALLKQIYIDQIYVPHNIYVPVDFEDRAVMEELLSEKRRANIIVPQRGDKRSLVDLAGKNAKQSYDQRFRVLKPTGKIIAQALQDALTLPTLPRRIECFDISHIQGAETVASMVVWEDGRMNKSAYRKFIIKTVTGVDDFASMREVITRRYKRLQESGAASSPAREGGFSNDTNMGAAPFPAGEGAKTSVPPKMPALILIDGGIGQLHSAAEALESLGITDQPLASIAKREEIIYVFGQEDDPVVLDHHNPVLHLVQLIRDEAHRFAITFHRKRRQMRDRSSELLQIPGIGETTMRRLLQHFGSLQSIRNADPAALAAVVNSKQAQAILAHFKV